MEQIAPFALPRSYRGKEEDNDSNEAAATTYLDSQIRRSVSDTTAWTLPRIIKSPAHANIPASLTKQDIPLSDWY